jgi:hypothetical protein
MRGQRLACKANAGVRGPRDRFAVGTGLRLYASLVAASAHLAPGCGSPGVDARSLPVRKSRRAGAIAWREGGLAEPGEVAGWARSRGRCRLHGIRTLALLTI